VENKLPPHISADHRLVSSSVEETERIGLEFSAVLTAGDVVGLIGDLGTGKTAFVRGVVSGLDETGDILVSSPSFTILARYPARMTVNHIDLFRLEPDDHLAVELEEYMTPETITLIEWAERLADATGFTWRITFEWIDEDHRAITISRR
jgi:tRNA threonylcarbamoyladenosine biosynthesis protein TsaE